MGSAEDCSEESQERSADQACQCSEAAGSRVVNAAKCLNAEGESQRKGYDAGCDAAEHVAFEVGCRDKCHKYII